ncbi:MAG: PD40 domain-containing protein, partial [Bacteroidia bacterium]|nr:PD40 domain-containing protein [Bacteroidia bacterium]
MKNLLLLTICYLLPLIGTAQDELSNPSFEEVLSLKTVGSPVLSPDGNHIAFTKSSADWKENRWDYEIWLSKDGQPAFQLTNTPEGNSGQIRWAPGGQWISFTANRGNKNQVYVININGGEAIQITHEEDGVQQYRWAPDGKSIIFTKSEPKAKDAKKRSERYGAYNVDDEEYRLTWLYTIPFDPYAQAPQELPCYDKDSTAVQNWPCIEWPKAEALIDSVDFTIRGFDISPDGKMIAITHSPDPLINSFFDADISILDLDSKKLRTAVNNPSSDNFVTWSPDSRQILYDT